MFDPVQNSILVIDDDEINRILISKSLRHEGYSVITAEDGNKALQQLEQSIPNLIISDIMMPELDGISLLKIIRGAKQTQAVPVILVTAQTDLEDLTNAFALGADDFIMKPFAVPELLARVRSKLERPPVPKDLFPFDPQTGYLTEKIFVSELDKEIKRASRSGVGGCLAYISLGGWSQLLDRFGHSGEQQILQQIGKLAFQELRPLDLVGRVSSGWYALLMPETSTEAAQKILETLSSSIATNTFKVGQSSIRLTPICAYSSFGKNSTLDEVQDQGTTALSFAENQLDLHPLLYNEKMGSLKNERLSSEHRKQRLLQALNLPLQIFSTYLIGVGVPFVLYLLLDRAGIDISAVIYLLVVIALVVTGLFIWIEGFLSLKKVDPPVEPGSPYPPASAIIAAYLPNEAATILDTIDAFLKIDYPNQLQVVLAYNSPVELPIEKTLQELQAKNPRLSLLKVQNSTSKAQNVNAALEQVTGEFVGIFDADHQPNPDSFTRAWRWLSNGIDIIQGHCVVRNGDASFISRMVAVEFEVIYGSSHPGRTRWHQFGIFGGSNGYWKTELLRKTRMHGFMLTEDIDSSFRALEGGSVILSDPQLYSKELAPVNLAALWHQRMRWAQGWFQVSLKHFWTGLRSNKFSWRQKLGLFWLLGWREIYPWISLQILPLIAFWILKYHGVDHLDWLIPIFVLATLFTFSVGPGQTIFAYLVSAREIKEHPKWFWLYLATSMLFYTELKNIIARVAQIKQALKEQQWKITPRGEIKPVR
jgi:diguanylate cyclase (GGDEF)-like protein